MTSACGSVQLDVTGGQLSDRERR